jgi:outer membrane protein assembly factor BamB
MSIAATDDYELSPVLKDASDTFAGRKGGVLMAVNITDGKQVAELKLDSIPVFDGLIAANGRLYVSLKDGSVACLASVP